MDWNITSISFRNIWNIHYFWNTAEKHVYKIKLPPVFDRSFSATEYFLILFSNSFQKRLFLVLLKTLNILYVMLSRPSVSSPGSSSRSCPAAQFAPWRTRTAPWTAWGTRPARRRVYPAKRPPRPSPSPPATVNVISDGQIEGVDELKWGYEWKTI